MIIKSFPIIFDYSTNLFIPKLQYTILYKKTTTSETNKYGEYLCFMFKDDSGYCSAYTIYLLVIQTHPYFCYASLIIYHHRSLLLIVTLYVHIYNGSR